MKIPSFDSIKNSASTIVKKTKRSGYHVIGRSQRSLSKKSPHRETIRRVQKSALETAEIALVAAETTMKELETETKYTVHGVHIVSAVVSGFISLERIVFRIHKTALNLLKFHEISKKIAAKESMLKRLVSKKEVLSSEYVQVQLDISNLKHLKQKCKETLFGFRKIPATFLDLSAASLAIVLIIGTTAKTLSQPTMTVLKTAGITLGSAAGGIGIILGGYEITQGIKKFFHHKRSQEIVHATFESLTAKDSATEIPEEIWNIGLKVRKTELIREEIKIRRAQMLTTLRICAGTLATITGALAIAGVCTAGWAAIGIGIAAGVIGTFSLSISIAVYIKSYQLKKQMNKETIPKEELETLCHFIIHANFEQQKELAQLFGVDEQALIVSPFKVLEDNLKKVLQK